MKSFALALFAATASASFADIMSFEFDQYFEKVEEMPERRLESYTYGWEIVGPEGTGLDSDPFYMSWDFSTVDFVFTANGDANFLFTTPFENSDDKTAWSLAFTPEWNLGGKQKLAANITEYFAFDLTLDLWPASFKFLDTKATWTPPFFEDFCWSSTWSLTVAKLYTDLVLGLYECDTGIFDWILNDNSHSCGVYAYKFKNHVFQLSYDDWNNKGDLFTETCYPSEEVPVEEPTDNNKDATAETTKVETTGLSSDLWF